MFVHTFGYGVTNALVTHLQNVSLLTFNSSFIYTMILSTDTTKILTICLKGILLMRRTTVVTLTVNPMAHGAIQQTLTPNIDGSIVTSNFVSVSRVL